MTFIHTPGSVSLTESRRPGDGIVRAGKSSGTLNTWKEIAGHLGRGVRTVQRWERDLGMPIHRPYGRPRTSVMALRTEIDAWAAKLRLQQQRQAAKSKR